MIGAALVAAPARAAIVTITFTGTYNNLTFVGVSDFAGWSTTGLTSIPFSYSLTYDTSLNDPNASRVTAGSVVGPYNEVASHDMYGYTSGGLLSVNKTLGNLNWGLAICQGESHLPGPWGTYGLMPTFPKRPPLGLTFFLKMPIPIGPKLVKA